MNTTLISEDDFENEYNPSASMNFDDVSAKMVTEQISEKHLWTIVEGDDNDMLYAIAGLHIVNAIDYVLTEKAWETGIEEAVWFDVSDCE